MVHFLASPTAITAPRLASGFTSAATTGVGVGGGSGDLLLGAAMARLACRDMKSGKTRHACRSSGTEQASQMCDATSI